MEINNGQRVPIRSNQVLTQRSPSILTASPAVLGAHSFRLALSMADDAQDGVASKLLTPTAAILSETFFFGLYTALFLFATVFIFFRRSPSHTRRAMLAVSVIMYAVSVAHWALGIADYVDVLKGSQFTRTPIKGLAIVYLPIINYILSDGIVLWRAWVLWNRRLSLFILPLISLVCTFGISVVSAVIYYQGALKHSKSAETVTQCLGWTIWGLTIGTNLWATGLISIRAWQHRRLLRSLYIKSTITSNAEKSLAFLVESGALYLCIWIAYVSSSTSLRPNGVLTFHSPLVQFVGLYPTAIVVVVTMRLSAADMLSQPGTSAPVNPPMVFNTPSPSPKTQLVEDVRSSMDGSVAVVSTSAASTRTRASSFSDK